MKTKTPLTSRIDGRLVAYTALATAALATPAIQNADATIIYSGAVNLNVPTTSSGIYLNFVTGVSAVTPAGSPGWDINPWGTTANTFWANNAASPNDGVVQNFTGGSSAVLVDNLPLGTLVDGTWTYGRAVNSETTGATLFNLNSSNNYIGIRFLNESTGVVNFGWAHFSLTGLGTQPRTLIDFAYDNTGAAIAVGAVPEPTTFGLLGLAAAGALGLRAWRGRKAA